MARTVLLLSPVNLPQPLPADRSLSAAPQPLEDSGLAGSHSLEKWFSEGVHAHDGQLRAWLRGSFPSVRGDVDDIAQESYLRIWRRHRSRPIASAKAFLFQTAKRLALDLVRKKRNSPFEDVGNDALSGVVEEAPHALERLCKADLLTHLADAISDLPPRQREVVLWHKIRGLPQRDVAEKLGLSERTIEKYCLKGMLRCEAFLRARGLEGFFR